METESAKGIGWRSAEATSVAAHGADGPAPCLNPKPISHISYLLSLRDRALHSRDKTRVRLIRGARLDGGEAARVPGRNEMSKNLCFQVPSKL